MKEKLLKKYKKIIKEEPQFAELLITADLMMRNSAVEFDKPRADGQIGEILGFTLYIDK